ncbi:MAG: hypothetical protein GX653_01270 [Clostridiales bacterium]|nr:hypothetical protein [Clostridiales bacterium]
MKRAVAVILLLILLTASAVAQQAAEPAALYTGRLAKPTHLLSQPNNDAPIVSYLSVRYPIEILEMAPDWLYIRTNGMTGYVRRRYVDDTRVAPVDAARTPKYPAVTSGYIGWVAQEAPVKAAPDAGSDTLITLHPGARLAFIGMENGWGKLIYHRQYGYVDTRLLSELQPLFDSVDTADDSAPIAAYTSFYRITTDETNLGRMQNITVACERMRPFVMAQNEVFDFNRDVGPYNARSGYLPANVLVDGETVLGYGGGTCQVSSTLYNALMQLPGLNILKRRPHGPSGASYLPLHADAAVGNKNLNLVFRNLYPFPVRIDGSAQDGALTILIWRVQE